MLGNAYVTLCNAVGRRYEGDAERMLDAGDELKLSPNIVVVFLAMVGV